MEPIQTFRGLLSLTTADCGFPDPTPEPKPAKEDNMLYKPTFSTLYPGLESAMVQQDANRSLNAKRNPQTLPPRIRVAQILEATGGGTARHVLDLATNLDRSRFEILLICSPGREAAFASAIRQALGNGIAVEVVPMVRGIAPVSDWRACRRVARLLEAWQPDIIHTHSSKAGAVGRLAARHKAQRAAVLHTPHCWPFEMRLSPGLSTIYAAVERRLARTTDRILCVCNHERQAALNRRIAASGTLLVVPNGVTPTESEPPPRQLQARLPNASRDRQTLLVVARLSRQKGHNWFLRAVAPLLKAFPRLNVELVGEGPEEKPLRKLCDRLEIAGQVQFHGFLAEPHDLYRRADAAVLPSLWEGLPYALLEAMGMGLPIVGTAVGGMPELITDGITGFLVTPGDGPALRDRLTCLIEDAVLGKRLGAAARELVRDNYTLSGMVSRIQRIYVEIAQQKGH